MSKILTAVAWSWGEEVWVKTHYTHTPGAMAEMLAFAISRADMVTGHYIRGFDLGLLNGNLMRDGLPPLGPIWTQDTKLDLIKTSGRSLSQKNLSAMLCIEAPKIDVSLEDWERFNTREPGAEGVGIERVRGDVIQHMQMRKRLLELGWLGSPRTWTPEGKKTGSYHG